MRWKKMEDKIIVIAVVVVVIFDLTIHYPLYNSKLVVLIAQSLMNHESELKFHDMWASPYV